MKENTIVSLLKISFLFFSFCVGFVELAHGQSNVKFDLVLNGGRIIDPETKLDAIRNIGIKNDRIAEISSEALNGTEVIDVTDLVVSPGFIDLHVHGRSNKEQEYQVHDGVTTALELEWGIEFLDKWYESRKSKALINYGASVNWAFERFKTFNDYQANYEQLQKTTSGGQGGLVSMLDILKPSFSEGLPEDQVQPTLDNIKRSLASGGVGIGIPIGYLPGATYEEVFRVYEFAGELNIPIFTHIREGGIMAIQQVISDAVLTGAPLHIVHINSMTLGNVELAIEMVHKAQSKGFDITTELYPYTAASTTLQSAMFDDDWQEKLGMDYEDLQWVATGERLSEKTFSSYRKEGGTVIMHMMQPSWIKAGIASAGTIIASDGMPYAKLAHPRTAGTFSRVLGKYVRDEKVLDLSEAINKMTLLSAKRLEKIAPMMRYKGRIQIGADADITVFDPERINDKATFEGGLEFSEGIKHVLVNGVFVVKDGKTIENIFPGQPIYGKFKQQ